MKMQRAAMEFRDSGAQGQSEARTVLSPGPGLIRHKKWLCGICKLLLSHTDPLIDNCKGIPLLRN